MTKDQWPPPSASCAFKSALPDCLFFIKKPPSSLLHSLRLVELILPASSVFLWSYALGTSLKAPSEVLLGPSPCDPCEYSYLQSLMAIIQVVYRVRANQEGGILRIHLAQSSAS